MRDVPLRRIGHAFAYLLGAVYLLPVLIAVINSFKQKSEILISAISWPSQLYLGNYEVVFTTGQFGKVFVYSVLITGSSIVLIISISACAGYALARWKRKAADWTMMLFMSAMFVPFHSIMITLLQTAKQVGATGNIPGLVMVYGALLSPITIFLYRGFVKSIAIEMEESGVIDGCSMPQLLVLIVFPLLKPISGTVAVLNAMWIWNDFLLPYLILAKPLTIPLSQMYFYGQYNQQWHLIMAGFVVSTLPLVIFFLFMQKFIVKGLSAGALKT